MFIVWVEVEIQNYSYYYTALLSFLKQLKRSMLLCLQFKYLSTSTQPKKPCLRPLDTQF